MRGFLMKAVWLPAESVGEGGFGMYSPPLRASLGASVGLSTPRDQTEGAGLGAALLPRQIIRRDAGEYRRTKPVVVEKGPEALPGITRADQVLLVNRQTGGDRQTR